MSENYLKEISRKIIRSKPHDHNELQANAIYALNASSNKYKNIKLNDSGELEVKDLSNKFNQYTGTINLNGSGASVYSDSLPAPTLDNDSRKGWLHTKTSAGTNKFNYYYYSQGSSPLTFGDIKNLKANITVDNYQSNS